MDSALVIQMVVASLAAVCLYTVIGFIPGTDETSVLLPVSLALVLAHVDPQVLLAFFIAAVVTLNLTNAIPTALVGLPGGVMSTPMLDHAIELKRHGLAASAIRKMAAGAILGTVISIPLSLVIARLIAPYSHWLAAQAPVLFAIGAVVLALAGRNRILAIVAIIPLGLLFQSLLALYRATGVIPKEGSISVSFFLSITIGPLLLTLLGLLDTNRRRALPKVGRLDVTLHARDLRGISLNPSKILTRAEGWSSSAVAAISSVLFVLSPVAQTILLGEAAGGKRDARGDSSSADKRSLRVVTAMSALSHSTYLSGIIIPLVAIGIPLSPVAVGPANALFNAPPVFTLDHNLHSILSEGQLVVAIVIGAVIALGLAYVLAVKFSFRITYFVMKYIPHEAVLGLFIGFILLLAYIDAGFINIFGVLLVGIVCGTLNRLGVNYGVQFMALYASPWIVAQLAGLR